MKLKEKFQRFWTLSGSRQGFTLVELIVVIAILAILAGVAIPVYNGYIKKAQTAADQTLLDSVNTAFAAACLENGISQYDVESANLPIKADGTVGTLSSVKLYNNATTPAGLYSSFGFYYAGNESSTFNTFKALGYANGMFVQKEVSAAYAALLGVFSEADITALSNSTFGQMGVGNLLGSVDLASGVAAGLLGGDDPDQRIVDLVYNDANYDTLAKALGYENQDDPDFFPALDSLVSQKAAQMANDSKYAGYSQTELEDAAMSAIMSNNAVLSVATNSNFDSTSFVGQLASGGAKDTIKANLATGGDLQTGLSQAALTYALYTSYAQQNGIEVSQDNALGSVLDALDDEGFMEYAASSQATTDVSGYLAAMNMVNSSYENKDVATDILLNGFSNEDLMTLLQSTLG